MDHVVEFGRYEQELDLDSMNREELLACLESVWARMAWLDEREPQDMGGEKHEAWGARHEELEDLVDEILELLDEREELCD